MELQDRFLAGDSAAWSELWVLSLEVCKRIITHERQRKGFFLNDDEFEDKAVNAVEYVLRRYRKTYKDGKTYRVKKNFVSALYMGVVHSLYYRKTQDRAFEHVYFFDEKILSLIDKPVYDKRKVKTNF